MPPATASCACSTRPACCCCRELLRCCRLPAYPLVAGCCAVLSCCCLPRIAADEVPTATLYPFLGVRGRGSVLIQERGGSEGIYLQFSLFILNLWQNPRPHTSLLWELGDISSKLERAIKEIENFLSGMTV